MRKSVWLVSAGLFALSTPVRRSRPTPTPPPRSRPMAPPPRPPQCRRMRPRSPPEADTSEIVVTATRRNEALSDVPLAVSAVTAETLENSARPTFAR